ncbi:MAG: DNA-3-methyladenine glycosylase 2 family protein [Pseudomonadota bacterium]
MATRIRSGEDLIKALDALVAVDERLAPARAAVGSVPLRLHAPGLEGLLRIVVGQQLSTASAAACWDRVVEALSPFDAALIAAKDDEALRAAGLSRQKAKTFRAVAGAVCDGLDLEALAIADPAMARETLEAICGIGRWSADLYLMFCAGHPDILPVGDLAVRRGAQFALELEDEPDPRALDDIGLLWSPHRSTATRLFYAYYRLKRQASPIGPSNTDSAGLPL